MKYGRILALAAIAALVALPRAELKSEDTAAQKTEQSGQDGGPTKEDFADYRPKRLLAGGFMQHGEFSNTYRFTPDEKFILTCGSYPYLRLWKVPGLEMVWEKYVEGYVFDAADFTPDGKHFLVALSIPKGSRTNRHYVKAVAVCETKTGRRVRLIKLPEDVSSPSAIAVGQGGKSFFLATTGGEISQWSLKMEIEKPDERVVKGLIEKLGDDSYEVRKKAAGDITNIGEGAVPFLEKASESVEIEVAHQTDELIGEIYRQQRIRTIFKGLNIVCIRLTSDKKRLAAILRGSVRVWDVESGDCLMNVEADSRCDEMDISPDGRWVAFSGPENSHLTLLYQYDESKKAYVECSDKKLKADGHIEFTPDGKKLIAHQWVNWRAGVFSVPEFKEVGEFGIKWQPVPRMPNIPRLSPRGNYLLTLECNYGCRLHKFDGKKPTLIKNSRVQFAGPMALSPDGSLVAQMLTDRKTCVVREVASGKILFKKQLSERLTYSLLFSPDNKHLVASGAEFRKTESNTYEAAKRFFVVFEIATGKSLWGYDKKSGEKNCRVLEFTRDGKILLERYGDSVNLRETNTGRKVKTIKYPAKVARLSPDGRKMFMVSDEGSAMYDTGAWRLFWLMKFNSFSLYTACFSQDGNTLLCGGEVKTNREPRCDDRVYLIDANTGRLRGKTHAFLIPEICRFDGRFALMGQEYRGYWIWDNEKGKEIMHLRDYGGKPLAVQATDGLFRIVVAYEDGSVWQWEKPKAGGKEG